MKNVEDIYVVSPMQQGLIFQSLYSPGTSVYFVQVIGHMYGNLNHAALRRAWQRVLERHTILRTCFVWEDMDEVLQIVRREVKLPWQELDWRDLSTSEQEAHLETFLAEDRNRNFDLTRAPLMRVTLIRLADRAYKFIWSHHHLLVDGWSGFLVFKEVFDLYAAFSEERELSLPPARPFRDYIEWLQQQDLVEAERFWRQRLKDFTSPAPLTRDRRAENGNGGSWKPEVQMMTVSEEITASLKKLARQHELTLNTLVQGAWALVLGCYSRERDLVFGTVVSGRPPELNGVETMVGPFINLLPMRVRLDGESRLLQWLRELQVVQSEMRVYEHSPLAQVQGWSELPKGVPLFESIMAFENYPVESSLAGGEEGLQVTELSSIEKTNYPLTFAVAPGANLLLQLSHDHTYFDSATAGRMLGHVKTALETIAANPDRRLREISLLSEAERQTLLVEWNETKTDYPRATSINRMFEMQVERDPAAIALVFEGERITYGELEARANRLARHLRSLGIGPEVAVGLCVERSAEMIVGLLAILKAGGVCVPLDPRYPSSRLSFMIKDAGARVLLIQERLRPSLPQHDAQVIALDRVGDAIADLSAQPLDCRTLPENLAYVIYTSGSTGAPKGVSITHRAVNRVVVQTNYIRLEPSDKVAHASSVSFDASIFEIWGALLNGAQLVGISRNTALSPYEFAREMREQKITVLFITTALFNQLASEVPLCFKSLRYLLFGGEAVEPRWVREVLRQGRPAHLLHMYGPTESTTYASWYEVEDVPQGERTIPIGSPVSNTECYILDENLQPVPAGVGGELYIGGDGLARGYLNHPELTAERFIPHPFSKEAGARLYRTGDLIRYRPGGEMEFLGRLDNQVKVRGFRIEVGEIEVALNAHKTVREAVVIVREDVVGDKRLVGYVSTEPGQIVTISELRRHLEEMLPEYMIPSAIVILDTLPLTPNGKIDRRALPAPDDSRPALDSQYSEPRTPAEHTLVEIWAQVLGVAQVGIHDNFFELGGDSILSIQIIARANRNGLRLTPKQLFDHPTISGLAAMADTAPSIKAEQGLVRGEATLTPIQRLFFAWELADPHHFNQALMLKVKAGTDGVLLKKALQHMLEHHDALRMRYTQDATGWRQVNDGAETLSWQHVSLRHLDDHEEQVIAIEAEAAQAQSSLHLSQGPLLRALHFDLGTDEPDRLLLIIHHLCVDAVSWRILLEDLEHAYTQLRAGEKVALPAKTTSYKQWAAELVKAAQSAPLRAEVEYWTKQAWNEAQPLPVDFAGGSNQVSEARSLTVSLNEAETSALLREVPEAYQTQINEVLVTALGRALRKWGMSGSAVVEMEGHGREEMSAGVDVTRTVGWFTSVYPVLVGGSGQEEIGAELKRVKEELRRIANRGVGYGMLRYLSEDERVRAEMERIPQGEMSFNYLGQFDQVAGGDGVFQGAEESTGRSQSSRGMRTHLLDVNGMVAKGCLEFVWTYSEQLHRSETIERLAQTYAEELREIIAHCQTKLRKNVSSSRAFASTGWRESAMASIENEVEDTYPVSPMQELMATQSLHAAGTGVYIPQLSCDLQGSLDVEAFRQAWQRVMERHSIFRTAVISDEAHHMLQTVHRQAMLPFEQQDWRSFTQEEQQARLQRFLEADRARGFDLAQVPLMRMTLIRLTESSYQFTWSHHHLLLDGWSAAVVLKEMFAFYEAAHNGEELYLEPTRPYRDYIQWLQQQDAGAAESFWRQTLAGFSRPTPLSFGRSDDQPDREPSNQYGEQELQLSAETTSALQRVARQHRLTLNTVMQGAWALVLSRYSGEAEVVYGAVLSGRPAELAGVETMVGLFINTLPVRVRVRGEQGVVEWLQALQTEQVEMRRYEYSGLAQVQRWSDVPADLPLFESSLRFQNYPVDPALRQEDADLRIVSARSVDHWHYALSLVVKPGVQMKLHISFEAQRFEGDAIRKVLAQLKDVLERITVNPSAQTVHDLLETGARQRDRR
jgi:amino acid adenylation domain-containing protein/non-ribosomal peptide synthase protein (TIGR01720 family)